MSNRVDALALRVETLSETVRATASGLAGRERELVTLRRELAGAQARVDSAVMDLQTRVDTGPVMELRSAVAVLTEDVSILRQGHDSLMARLDSLTDAAATTRASLTAHERALGELSQAAETGNARIDSVVDVVRQAVESLVAHVDDVGGRAPAERSVQLLEQRLDALGSTVETLAGELESLSAASADRERELAAAYRELDEAKQERPTTPSLPIPPPGTGELADELAGRRVLIEQVRAQLAASDRRRSGTSDT